MIENQILASQWHAEAEQLKSEGWWLAALCGLDRLHLGTPERFGIVVQLLHRDRKERRTVHIAAEGDPPSVPSVTDLWPGAGFPEREAYDLFGIQFEGHPNLTRILMPDEWEGHPLRKDYAVGKVPVDYLPQPFLQIDAQGQSPRAAEANVELDHLGQVVEVEDAT